MRRRERAHVRMQMHGGLAIIQPRRLNAGPVPDAGAFARLTTDDRDMP